MNVPANILKFLIGIVSLIMYLEKRIMSPIIKVDDGDNIKWAQ